MVDQEEYKIWTWKKLDKEKKGLYVYNLGAGKGVSVLEIINTFERVNNIKINYEIAPRRDGDLAIFFADPTKAKKELDWEVKRNIEDMCRDSWNFMKNNK